MLDGYVTEELKKAYESLPKQCVLLPKEKKDSAAGIVGWICPVCGRGLSPFTSVCPCKGWNNWEITC